MIDEPKDAEGTDVISTGEADTGPADQAASAATGTEEAQTEQGTPPVPPGSSYQREEMDAALRADTYDQGLDSRGIALAAEAAGRVRAEMGDAVEDWQVFRDEHTLVIRTDRLRDVALFLRDTCGFALLSDISPCDWDGQEAKRFSIQYILTRLVPGAPRLRLRVWVDEGESVPSLVSVYPTADWHEREAYDFFGIDFAGHPNLVRLLMSDDWVGHPLRKDYPIGGEPVKFTNFLRETAYGNRGQGWTGEAHGTDGGFVTAEESLSVEGGDA